VRASGIDVRSNHDGALAVIRDLRSRVDDAERERDAAENHGWRKVSEDTAFAPPFSTVRACIDCGVLVAGGPTRCTRCANDAGDGLLHDRCHVDTGKVRPATAVRAAPIETGKDRCDATDCISPAMHEVCNHGQLVARFCDGHWVLLDAKLGNISSLVKDGCHPEIARRAVEIGSSYADAWADPELRKAMLDEERRMLDGDCGHAGSGTCGACADDDPSHAKQRESALIRNLENALNNETAERKQAREALERETKARMVQDSANRELMRNNDELRARIEKAVGMLRGIYNSELPKTFGVALAEISLVISTLTSPSAETEAGDASE
jgi:hypothetical protein